MTRNPSFLDSSLRLNGITEILQIVLKKQVYFHELFRSSQIQYKKSFLNYLKFCVEKQFVKKTLKKIARYNKGKTLQYVQQQNVTYYGITKKGKKFLELLN